MADDLEAVDPTNAAQSARLSAASARYYFGPLYPQAIIVFCQRVLEQRAFLGRYGLGLGVELPAFLAGEFEVDPFQLSTAPSDLAGLVLDLL